MICLGAGSPAPGESEISVKSTKILNMGKNRLLIVFTGVIIQLLLASCTYDYFKDETNYQVYVPEVVDTPSPNNCTFSIRDTSPGKFLKRTVTRPV